MDGMLTGEQPVTIRGFDGKPMQVTPSQLAEMPAATLTKLRDFNTDNQQNQNLLGDMEHRAFVREFVRNQEGYEVPFDPVTRAAAMTAATPVWNAAKMLPRDITGIKSRSDPSWNQVKQGWIGAGEGLMGYAGDVINPFIGRVQRGIFGND